MQLSLIDAAAELRAANAEQRMVREKLELLEAGISTLQNKLNDCGSRVRKAKESLVEVASADSVVIL